MPLDAGRALLATVLALLVAAGCNEAPAGKRIERVADTVYADRLIGDGGTARLPYTELAGETRISCANTAAIGTLSGTHFSHDLTLRPGDVVELAFALEGAGFAGEVEFIATVIGKDGERATFRMVLDGTEGRELGRWHEANIDIESIVGPARIELATASSVIGGDAQSPARPHFACPIVVNRRIAPEPRPSVIVISLDTLRADRLGIYGYERATSPHLDALFGRDGVVVEHAYSQATNTLRGHAAMLTGLNPAISVAVGAGKHRSGKATRGMPSLADHLRRYGYRTAAFTEGGYVSASYGFANGFDVFVETKNPDVGSGEIDKTFAKAEEWARSHADEPLFLFVHTYEVHSPYEPPAPYRDRFPAAPGASRIEIESALYDAEIAYTDARFAQLIEALRSRGVLDDAILVVTSDHGEEFGEHGGRYHGAHLHDEVVRVPFLVLAPERLPRGVRRSGPAALVDLVPSVLDLAGLPVPDYLSGASLVEHWRTGAAAPVRSIASEAFTPIAHTVSGSDDTWQSPSLALTRFPMRVIRINTTAGPRYEAYDLARDPGELGDVYAELRGKNATIDELATALDAYESHAEQEASRISALLGLPPGSASAQGASTDTNRDRLRALGYVE